MSMRLECLSHTPLHGYYDPAAEILAEVEQAQAAARVRVERFDPELMVLFAPDHYNGYFYDLMPPFALGVQARAIGDFESLEGPLRVPKDLALQCARQALEAGVDLSISYRMQVDHAVQAFVVVLQAGEIADRAEIVAEMEIAGRLHAGQDAALQAAGGIGRQVRIGRGCGDVGHGMWTPLKVEGRGVWTSAHPAGGRQGRSGMA